MDEDRDAPQSAWSDLLAGAGLGLLLGMLVSLSSSPVVAGVVGALTSVLAVFIGLDVSTGSILGAVRVNAPRIGALGIATVIGLGLGLYVRINNPLAQSPTAQLARWNAAFPDDPTLAKQMMLFERSGIRPASFQYGREPPQNDIEVAEVEGAQTRQAMLFSTLIEFDACRRLDPAGLANADDLLARYSRSGAPEGLPQVGAAIAALPPEDRGVALAIAHKTLCTLQEIQKAEETP